MLLRELIGGDPPHACKLILIDDPTGFGHRVTDGGLVLEHVLTQAAEFERVVAVKIAEGFVETERSLTRRVFAQGLASTPVLDCTPFIPHKRGRGQEIQRWLDAAPPLAGLVILDDEADMLHLAPWLVQTSFETGLLDAHADAALAMLERAPPSAS